MSHFVHCDILLKFAILAGFTLRGSCISQYDPYSMHAEFYHAQPLFIEAIEAIQAKISNIELQIENHHAKPSETKAPEAKASEPKASEPKAPEHKASEAHKKALDDLFSKVSEEIRKILDFIKDHNKMSTNHDLLHTELVELFKPLHETLAKIKSALEKDVTTKSLQVKTLNDKNEICLKNAHAVIDEIDQAITDSFNTFTDSMVRYILPS
ncbi:hypothetical protein DdX_15468 [Ditylenchus destructor]|uniref:Uncharacterized protein n=1 Tax=Ditylenchus destructor TaxID=166010 RepID=A0AAD4MQU1_9BILA|nr:hypothetical protein DdX_15468 [Ditylenchus destructor]